MLNTDGPWIFGHRGAAGLAPENTLTGLRQALACGVDGVEIDVQLAHGELWLLHDTTLDRTTNGHGTLVDHSPEALRGLDAGAGDGLTTLPEFLAELPGAVAINVELKGSGTGAATAALLQALRPPRALVSSFKWEELDAYRKAGGDAPLSVLTHRLNDAALRKAQGLRAWSLNLNQRWLTRSAVSRARAAGYRVLAFTVNDPAVAHKLYSWGVDGFFTDFPNRVRRPEAAS